MGDPLATFYPVNDFGPAMRGMVIGGGGIDTVSYSSVTTRIVANLGTGTVAGAGGTDTLVSIENVSGGTAGDSLTGNALANTLTGNAGSDVLTGIENAIGSAQRSADVFNPHPDGTAEIRLLPGPKTFANGTVSFGGTIEKDYDLSIKVGNENVKDSEGKVILKEYKIKTADKEIAYKHGIMETFMAKINENLPGCSGHVHQSLCDAGTQENLFHDKNAPDSMSDLMRSYMAGQHVDPHPLSTRRAARRPCSGKKGAEQPARRADPPGRRRGGRAGSLERDGRRAGGACRVRQAQPVRRARAAGTHRRLRPPPRPGWGSGSG